MKILIVSIWPIEKCTIGGTERFIVHLASTLAERGHHVDVLSLSGNREIINGVSYLTVPFKQKVNEYTLKSYLGELSEKNLTKFSNLFSKFDSASYDIVHLNSLILYETFIYNRRILTIHNYPFELDQAWGKTNYPRVCKIIKRHSFYKTVFTSPSKTYSKIQAIDLNKPVLAIPHAVDMDHITTTLNRDEICRKLGIPNKFTIFLPSRLELEQKRPDLALKAIAIVKNKLPDFQVIFAGVDSHYEKNKKPLRLISLRENISSIFLKPTSMSDLYKISHLVVLPSKWESFGYCAVEALSLSIKTVLTDIPSFKSIARGNPYAFVSKQSKQELANTIVRAVNTTIEKTNIEPWSKKYSVDTWVSKYEKLYESVMR